MQGSWIIGYELTDQFVQISYYDAEKKEPQTADPSMGLQKFQIPAVLLKIPGTEEYLFGAEAVREARAGRGVLHDDLLSSAVHPEGRGMHPMGGKAVDLLAVFIRKSLKVINTECKAEDIYRICFTLPEITYEHLQVVRKVSRILGLSPEQVTVQDYQESFYSYTIHQKQELRSYAVALFHCEKNTLEAYELLIHRKSFPKVVTVKKTGGLVFVPEDKSYLGSAGGSYDKEKDQKFGMFIEEMFRTKIFSTVFLTGDGFDTSWYPASLKRLCRGRRVFSGKNLYVKGACYRAMDEAAQSRGMEFLYMGKHKITYNIGMEVQRNGRKEYFGIISAGVNWFDAKGSCEFLLDRENSVELCIQAIDRSDAKRIRIPLEGLPERPNKTTRLHLDIEFTGVRECRIDIRDCGFGEWFPASEFTWRERLKL